MITISTSLKTETTFCQRNGKLSQHGMMAQLSYVASLIGMAAHITYSHGYDSMISWSIVFFNFFLPSLYALFITPKETALERADFALPLLMFVTAEKEGRMFSIFFLSSFCQLLSPRIQARTGWKLRPTGVEGSSF